MKKTTLQPLPQAAIIAAKLRKQAQELIMLADELEGTTSRDLNSIPVLDVRTEIAQVKAAGGDLKEYLKEKAKMQMAAERQKNKELKTIAIAEGKKTR